MTFETETHPSEAGDPAAQRELDRVVALLQSLPDPAPPVGLTDRVMVEVRRREARPRILRAVFGPTSRPVAATALAAGLACLAVFATLERAPDTPVAREALEPMAARPVDVPIDSQVQPAPEPFVSMPVGLLPAGPGAVAPGSTNVFEVSELLARRLDYQLNRLLLDPTGFYRQLERHPRREVLLGRLASRAAERGDAVGIALGLRESAPDDPTTEAIMTRLLEAAVVQSLEKH